MQEDRQYCVYIMMNKGDTVSYVGMTSKLIDRVWQHKQKLVKGFTQRYNLIKLVYYEVLDTPQGAIAREKEIKKWSRHKKIELIKKLNPGLHDLSQDWRVYRFLPRMRSGSK